jgi:hypothetical protein
VHPIPRRNVTVDAIQAYLKDPAAARLWQDRAQFDDIVLFDRYAGPIRT